MTRNQLTPTSTHHVGRRHDGLHPNSLHHALMVCVSTRTPTPIVLDTATSKGVYLRKVAVSSTMGVGVRVDTQSINA